MSAKKVKDAQARHGLLVAKEGSQDRASQADPGVEVAHRTGRL